MPYCNDKMTVTDMDDKTIETDRTDRYRPFCHQFSRVTKESVSLHLFPSSTNPFVALVVHIHDDAGNHVVCSVVFVAATT